jgi:hypothetical protein
LGRSAGSACFWKYHNGHGGEWETQCGAWYDADDFGCSSIRRCPKCGRETTTVKPNELLSDSTVIKAMRQWGGGFVSALAEAATRADSDNLRRIKEAWPEYWQKYSDMANDQGEAQPPAKNL